MTIKKFLIGMTIILSIVGVRVELLGADLEFKELTYSFVFSNYSYFYEKEAIGKKEQNRALKKSKTPSDYVIGTFFGYSFTGENNADEFVSDFQSTNYIAFFLSIDKPELKNYRFWLFDADNKIMKNKIGVKYLGYTNNKYSFYTCVDISKEDLLQNKLPEYIGIELDDNVYIIRLRSVAGFNDLQSYIRQLEREDEKRQQEEYEYKNSKEYKQLQLQKLLNELNKNKMYDIKKDNFNNRIHVTSKRIGDKIDNNILNLLNKNNLFISPRCEINSEYGYLDFGMTITQKASLTKGSVYIKGISFSNGDESVTIRTGNYGVGQVGKVININGLLDGVQMTARLDEGYVDDLYNILINAKKPVMVRIHAGEWTYDSVISDLEKNMFIDILKIKQLKDGVKN